MVKAPAGPPPPAPSSATSSRSRATGSSAGAGPRGGATPASAALGDLVAVARNRVIGGRGPRESSYASLPVLPIGAVPTRYHVSLDVADRAGVLSGIAGEFAHHDVSIAAVRQTGADEGTD